MMEFFLVRASLHILRTKAGTRRRTVWDRQIVFGSRPVILHCDVLPQPIVRDPHLVAGPVDAAKLPRGDSLSVETPEGVEVLPRAQVLGLESEMAENPDPGPETKTADRDPEPEPDPEPDPGPEPDPDPEPEPEPDPQPTPKRRRTKKAS
ncbi:MAG: hypothetical protein AAGC60_00330 [Acidobacteriota bacterium]